jgi:ferredoxin-NADP reductase
MKTGEQGSFDLRCIVPFSQTRIVLFHFADNRLDLMGNDQFQLAESIYPNLVEVVYMTSATLSADKIAMHLDNSSRNIQVIACGPVGLNSRIVEILSGFGGFWIDKLRLMRNNSWS